ncbi:MAG: hypothetical protein U0263_39745 [Polyangiaceae bacterium]
MGPLAALPSTTTVSIARASGALDVGGSPPSMYGTGEGKRNAAAVLFPDNTDNSLTWTPTPTLLELPQHQGVAGVSGDLSGRQRPDQLDQRFQ